MVSLWRGFKTGVRAEKVIIPDQISWCSEVFQSSSAFPLQCDRKLLTSDKVKLVQSLLCSSRVNSAFQSSELLISSAFPLQLPCLTSDICSVSPLFL